MTIVGCRIDGRLIHGQVANLWAGKLNVSRIMHLFLRRSLDLNR